MALANVLSTLVPKIIAGRSLEFLRENAVMPRLVNNISDKVVGKKGDVITLPDSAALTVADVTVGATPPNPANSSITAKYVTLSRWRKVSFGIDDRDITQILDTEHFVPVQMQEAMKSLGNDVDSYILSLYTGIWNHSGVAGTTPFATNLSEYANARAALNRDLAPVDNRKVVLDPDAEANALTLDIFARADARGDQGGVIQGEIGHKVGADWFLNQNIPTHTAGTWAITGPGYNLVKAAATAGTSTFILQGGASSTNTSGGTVVAGDVFFVTGDPQAYTIKTGGTVAVGAQATLALVVSPPFRFTVAANATVTFNGSTSDFADSITNLIFHPNAFAFCSRPMVTQSKYLGSSGHFSSTVRDPVTGIGLRLEVIREYKQWLVDFDILYGCTLVRPELACRILG